MSGGWSENRRKSIHNKVSLSAQSTVKLVSRKGKDVMSRHIKRITHLTLLHSIECSKQVRYPVKETQKQIDWREK